LRTAVRIYSDRFDFAKRRGKKAAAEKLLELARYRFH
jgi:hypothetical protein